MRVIIPDFDAFAPILNRAEARLHVTEHFSDIIATVADIVDYGTHLIPRCWSGSPKALTDVVLLPVLTKQAIGFLDAGCELLQVGCVNPALLQLRGLFEVSIYIAWIVKRDSDRRARAYYVANLRRNLHWAKRARRGTEESRALGNDFRTVGERSPFTDRQHEVVADICRLQDRLCKADFRQMNAAFDRRRGKRTYDPEWYSVLFPKKRRASLYKLSCQVGRRAEYRLIYEQGSEMMHSSRMDTHVRVGEDKLHIRSLRELTDMSLTAQLLMGEAITLYQTVLRRYRPSEVDNFARKYANSWRRSYLSWRTVNYQFIEKVIG